MSKILVIVDRLEGEFAVVEFPDRTTKDVPLDQLLAGVKAGDCFWFEEDKYVSDQKETVKRKAKIAKLAQSMWND